MRLSLLPVFVLGTALVWPAAASAQRVHFDPEKTYQVPIEGMPSIGPEDALVTVVELSDFYCGFCRRANTTLRQLMHLYPREVRVVYVHTPLDPDEGTLAAEASLVAAAQGQFWPMHDRLFAGPRGVDRALVIRYARELGLDVARFERELDSRAHLPALAGHVAIGRKLGARSTPIFFVNGRPIVGARGLGTFVNAVERELEAGRKALKAGASRDGYYQRRVSGGEESGTTTPVEPYAPPKIEDGRRYPVGLGLSSHRRGKDDALVTLVEFSDFECPYCRRAAPTVDKLKEIYGDDLRVVFRHAPLPFHAHAQLASEAAVEAGRQGKFWPYHDLLLANQQALGRADLERYARELDLDMKAFRAALDDRRHMKTVLEDFAGGAVLGVRGTPSFFINGVAMVGARPLETFKMAIDAELALAKQLVAGGVKREQLYDFILANAAEPAASVGIDTKGPVILEQGDYHLAVLIACRGGDAEQAKHFFGEITEKRRKKSIREDCKKMGIELP